MTRSMVAASKSHYLRQATSRLGAAVAVGLLAQMAACSGDPELTDHDKVASASSPVEVLSKATAIPADRLRILDSSPRTLRFTGMDVQLYKVVDTRTGESYSLALDADGNALNYASLLRDERALEYQQYGSMHPALHRQVERSAAGDEIPVLIKLAVAETPMDKSLLSAQRLAEDGAAMARAHTMAVEAETRDRFRNALAGRGVQREPRVVSGPFVSAVLPAKLIAQLARDPGVAFIGRDDEKIVHDYPTIPESLPTTRTDWAHTQGARGAGVNIAVLESGQETVNKACFNVGAEESTSGSGSSHMTSSLAIIGNRYNAGLCNGTWQGYAPDATVLMANGSNYQTAYDWAKTQGVNVVTMSWHYPSEETDGGLHSRDVYFDYQATHYPYPSIFTSAGNQAASGAYASGKGYNFFGVANVENDGDGDRCNDVISASSSFKDPISTHGDREVPLIASPGSRHDLLGTSFGGTSAATPVTASIAAVLMSRNAALKTWPEAIRAILMATANYQSADGTSWNAGDGKDGAGLTNTQYALWTTDVRESGTTAQYRAHDYGTMTSASFAGGFMTKTWTAQAYNLSSRIRVAFTWNSKTTTSSSVLDSDLDVWLYDPDGVLVAVSSTWDSNNELIEFTPTKAGQYTIKVRGFNVPSDLSSYYGIAWTTHYELCN